LSPQNQLPIDKLIERLIEQAGVPPRREVIHQLKLYFEELQKWNKVTNLTAIDDPEELVLNFLGDTLTILKYIPKAALNMLDIGSGAGVPGLIVKVFRPDLKVVLVEATRKKVSFLKTVIVTLGLKGITAEHGRVGEAWVPKKRPEGGFDVITARALTSLERLILIAAPLLSSRGMILAMKGPRGVAEARKAKSVIQKLGLNIEMAKATVPILRHERTIILVKKMA